MDNEIKDYLINFNVSKGYGTSDADLRETLREEHEVYKRHLGGSRWWETWFHVAKVGDKFIGYDWAEANRDESIFDLGWEFDWTSVVEVFPKEIVTTIYTNKEEL